MKWYNYILKALLIPLSWLYGAVVFVRNMLFDAHLLPSFSVSVPTICVGNLAVGGTGKTPHVEYLIRLLKDKYKIAVLSRGYGRKTHGFVLADAKSSAATIGDEMMQMHTKFPDIAMAVCADRVKGIKMLQQRVQGLQVVILDDAYQHRRLKCGFNILLTPYDRLYLNDHMMPRGRLREPIQGSLRAQVIIVTKCPDSIRPIDMRVVDDTLHLPAFQTLCFSRIEYEALPADGTPLVVTGIAHPEYMMDYVSRFCPKAKLLAFADHHDFSEADINRIAHEAEQYDYILTTEKDKARLDSHALPDSIKDKIYTLPIKVKMLARADILNKQILSYINHHGLH